MTAAERQVRRIRFALFRSIMNQEMGWFDKLNPGELSSRLVADLGKRWIMKVLELFMDDFVFL